MELHTTHSALSTPQLSLSFNNQTSSPHLRFSPNGLSHFPGVLVSHKKRPPLLLLLRIRADTSSQSSSPTEEKIEEVATVNVNVNANADHDEVSDESKPSQVNVDDQSSLGDETLQTLKAFFNKLNIQLDVEETSTILLNGGGTLVAAWLLSAIVGAVDSIPVLPKLLEIVGLGYSIWFTRRYLLFKKNREELGYKIEELKQKIFGSSYK